MKNSQTESKNVGSANSSKNADAKKDVKYSNTGVGLANLNRSILSSQFQQIKNVIAPQAEDVKTDSN